MPAAALSRRIADYSTLLLVTIAAALLRILFYTGPMGSDDVVYTKMAIAIMHGDWSAPPYVGALRYGVNLPVAALMSIFGTTEFVANLWSLLCGIGEVAIVYVLANRMWGERAAVLSALVLALVPLHINLSGRLLADAPLAFFLTLSMALFYFAEQRSSVRLYLAAGLALGAVYWIKESVAVLVVPVFVMYAIVNRVLRKEWLWLLAAATSVFALNLVFMWVVFGDPAYAMRAASTSVDRIGDSGIALTSPLTYFRYLFIDVRHTWLLGFLGVAGFWAWYRRVRLEEGASVTYVAIWAVTLVLVLSFFVTSLFPVRFIPKQTNYMQLFLAPLAMLGGYWLAHSRARWMAWTAVSLFVSGALFLAAMEQQAVRVFVANSRAALAFQAANPGGPIYGSSQAYSLAVLASALGGAWPPLPKVLPIDDLDWHVVSPTPAGIAAFTGPMHVIVDPETGGLRRNSRFASIPACWEDKGALAPIGFGIGQDALEIVRDLAGMLPQRLGAPLLRMTSAYYMPEPAHVYEIPRICSVH
jgi:4-amino-4-deoxy-L-arabinose transferase-like glycosyltransferase